MGNYIKLKKVVTDFYEKAALTILQILFITMWFSLPLEKMHTSRPQYF